MFMGLDSQMADIRVNNRQGGHFNTGSYGALPKKIKILNSEFPYAKEDQKICTEPNFHESRSSNGYN